VPDWQLIAFHENVEVDPLVETLTVGLAGVFIGVTLTVIGEL
jgi:hypothetical protein